MAIESVLWQSAMRACRTSYQTVDTGDALLIVIAISKLLKRYSKAKRTSLFTSAATNQRGVSKGGGQEKLRSDELATNFALLLRSPTTLAVQTISTCGWSKIGLCNEVCVPGVALRKEH